MSADQRQHQQSVGNGSENVQSTINNDQDKEMNSSCKDTMKMNDRKDFSFVE